MSQRPVATLILFIFLILAAVLAYLVSTKGTNPANYCFDKEIDCQVYLHKGSLNPYRKDANLNAAYTGWHFAGHTAMKTCWVGLPTLCEICDDTITERKRACQQRYPQHVTRPGRGIKFTNEAEKE